MLQLKVCGMRDAQNITDLVAVAPQFMGFIFHKKSPRNITNEVITVPEPIQKVGVFVNEPEGFLLDNIERYNFKYIQLHGDESPLYCKRIRSLNRKIIKAFNLHEEFDFSILEAYEPYCEYFLFDSLGPKAGGNGISFNWNILDQYEGSIPFFLSGGISPTMVDSIKKIKHPKLAGIDINSAFECSAAIKDINKIKDFKDELQH